MTVSWRRVEGISAKPAPQRSVGPELRDVEPDDVATRLRGLLGLPPEDPASEEAAAFHPEAMPPLLRDLDAGGWIAWCLAGLPLFAGEFPSSRAAYHHTKRFMVALAMVRSQGNLSGAARLLQLVPNSVLDSVRRLGLGALRRHCGSGDKRRARGRKGSKGRS